MTIKRNLRKYGAPQVSLFLGTEESIPGPAKAVTQAIGQIGESIGLGIERNINAFMDGIEKATLKLKSDPNFRNQVFMTGIETQRRLAPSARSTEAPKAESDYTLYTSLGIGASVGLLTAVLYELLRPKTEEEKKKWMPSGTSLILGLGAGILAGVGYPLSKKLFS